MLTIFLLAGLAIVGTIVCFFTVLFRTLILILILILAVLIFIVIFFRLFLIFIVLLTFFSLFVSPLIVFSCGSDCILFALLHQGLCTKLIVNKKIEVVRLLATLARLCCSIERQLIFVHGLFNLGLNIFPLCAIILTQAPTKNVALEFHSFGMIGILNLSNLLLSNRLRKNVHERGRSVSGFKM